MNQKVRRFLKNWIPPALLGMLPGKSVRWSGDYASWEEAKGKCTGYESEIILQKVRDSLLKVKKGQAPYERDSVLFDEIEYSWGLLAALMWVAAQSEGELNIIDFGGSLGSTYFQNRKFLASLSKVQWNIVEQKHFVDAGKESFESERIKFFYDVETAAKESSANAVLFSSVIQYLEEPFALLEKVKALAFEFILLDRTPFTLNGRDRLTIQKVASSIYPASFPCWFFDRKRFFSFFEDRYITIAAFQSLDRANIPSTFEGCILRKKS